MPRRAAPGKDHPSRARWARTAGLSGDWRPLVHSDSPSRQLKDVVFYDKLRARSVVPRRVCARARACVRRARPTPPRIVFQYGNRKPYHYVEAPFRRSRNTLAGGASARERDGEREVMFCRCPQVRIGAMHDAPEECGSTPVEYYRDVRRRGFHALRADDAYVRRSVCTSFFCRVGSGARNG